MVEHNPQKVGFAAMGNRNVTNVEDVFGVRLREERLRRGWSQGEVAARLADEGVVLHWSAVAKMEARDATRPRAIRLQEAAAVAKVLGLDLADMLKEPDPSARALAAANRAQEAQREATQRWEEALAALAHMKEVFDRAEATAVPDSVGVLRNRWHELQHANRSDQSAKAILQWMDRQLSADTGKQVGHGKPQ